MAIEFILPELGENIDSGDVIKVLVAVGDSIQKDQPVLELETGKATVEVPSTVSGRISQILVKEGQRIAVGQPVLRLDGAGAAEAPPAKEAPARQPATAPVEKAPPAEAPKPTAAPATAAPVAPPAPAQAPAPPKSGIPPPAAPSVRKFAREIGIDLAAVPAGGPGGRITIDDVKAYSKRLNEGRIAAPVASGVVAAPPLPDFSKWGPVEREAMSAIRKVTAQHMAVCWSTIPHVTQHDKADITELEKLRKRFSKKAEEVGGKLTPTAILLKVAASALKVFPKFNASIDTASNSVIYKKYYHLGVAVDTPRGLLVPVIRDVDKKNIIDLAVELTELAAKARDGKISPSDLQGGTFTLTNLGGIGGTYFTPIVNHPEVAILGVGRGVMEPVFVDGEFVPRLMLPLSLSYDHRLVDGADGARFLRWICEAINEPLLLALEG